MRVTILGESFHQWALDGLWLSYHEIDDDLYRVDNEEPALELLKKLANKDGGHNKALESVAVAIDIDAPLYWWSQMDTYRCGVTKQSESKMHTMLKRELTQDDFEGGILPGPLSYVNYFIREKNLEDALKHLPMGFLQRRIIVTNYKAIRTIYSQRRNHKLKQWRQFCAAMKSGLDWPWALETERICSNEN